MQTEFGDNKLTYFIKFTRKINLIPELCNDKGTFNKLIINKLIII